MHVHLRAKLDLITTDKEEEECGASLSVVTILASGPFLLHCTA